MGRFALGLFCALSLAVPALAQERVLHVGLREDPDILDPTLGSSYVGRIVFSGICDKLFDIDAKLNIVPQLATGSEWKDPTHLLIHLRDGVTFQDGEKLNADAQPFGNITLQDAAGVPIALLAESGLQPVTNVTV